MPRMARRGDDVGREGDDGPARGATTELLAKMGRGDIAARDEVFRRLYDELHRIASRVARRRGGSRTLEATDLVGEAYRRLARAPDRPWANRAHFLNTAAAAMRQVLVDHVRRSRAA